jgi:hypothetical protein
MKADTKVGRTRAALGVLTISIVVVLSHATPTPVALSAGAVVLSGVAVVVWAMRCPHCSRRLGPIVGFKYCTSCGGRIA